jgi:RimJ/RimL family protein N-acetyltransferase
VKVAPVLETNRLLLRAHELRDYSQCVEMWSDPAVTQYTIGSASTKQRTWLRILGYPGHWSLLGYGYWAVEEKASGNYIGELGYADFKRDIQPSIQGIPELGWALMSQAHGKGYATEALQEVVRWGDQSLDQGRTVCIITPDNTASIRVAHKLGFREFARTKVTEASAGEILFSRENANHVP